VSGLTGWVLGLFLGVVLTVVIAVLAGWDQVDDRPPPPLP
jgi:hypothetical protein